MGSQVYHYPSTVKVGLAQCRNVQIAKVPREEVDRNGAAIGVNGIRMQTLSEVTATGTENPIEQLLSLPVSPTGVISDKKISSHNFAELDYIVSDPVEYTSTSTAEYQFKEWTATQQAAVTKASLSSYGLKAGDTIRMQCQMKRDANAIANSKSAYIVMQFWDADNKYIKGSVWLIPVRFQTYIRSIKQKGLFLLVRLRLISVYIVIQTTQTSVRYPLKTLNCQS